MNRFFGCHLVFYFFRTNSRLVVALIVLKISIMSANVVSNTFHGFYLFFNIFFNIRDFISFGFFDSMLLSLRFPSVLGVKNTNFFQHLSNFCMQMRDFSCILLQHSQKSAKIAPEGTEISMVFGQETERMVSLYTKQTHKIVLISCVSNMKTIWNI